MEPDCGNGKPTTDTGNVNGIKARLASVLLHTKQLNLEDQDLIGSDYTAGTAFWHGGLTMRAIRREPIFRAHNNFVLPGDDGKARSVCLSGQLF